MTRLIKNKKRIDPRYFLTEAQDNVSNLVEVLANISEFVQKNFVEEHEQEVRNKIQDYSKRITDEAYAHDSVEAFIQNTAHLAVKMKILINKLPQSSSKIALLKGFRLVEAFYSLN